ncbi:MAG: MBL fold metallo-hydrolase [Epsilonproteobacteria bacterium]|nr:MBL fold metallo-hydrolase [Campylobacterota bacterium]
MSYIQSYGATEVVTGSCHIIRLKSGRNIMIDCGMFQGEVEHRNYEPFGFDPSKIDVLLITHAHLDHVGRIPLLVKEGFKGRIVTLKSTMDLAEVVLLDSANLMEEEFRTRYRKAQRRGEEDSVRKPLYTVADVEDIFNLPIEYVKYGRKVEILKGVFVTFFNAGHILDSAIIEVDLKREKKRLVFSGDLGNRNDIVMPNPDILKSADVLYIESTYGDRNHKSLKDSVEEFKKVILETLLEGGNVVIPSFAIERTQEILCLLKRMYKQRELPECKIFIDSPMAIRATRLYREYYEELSKECRKFLMEDGEVFDFPFLEYTLKVEDSKKINGVNGCIIIAGSGMCNGGRILHHFKHRLWNPKNSILFVGYQAKGTLGRAIVDGERWVRIYNEEIKIRAKIYTINGFSAHADQRELIEWMSGFERLNHIYLVHGERDKQLVFKKAIKEKMNKKAHIVSFKEKIYI